MKYKFYKILKNNFSYYHSLLGLKSTCTKNDIKTAYYKLSKQYHPDLNNGIHSELYIEVQQAYRDLMKDYDYKESQVDDIDIILNKLKVQSMLI
jgi:curved DNA-binding protein CbpA